MKSSGIVGLVGGILLLICPFVLLGTAVNTDVQLLMEELLQGLFQVLPYS
ncbi:integral membrane protein [Streptococcus pneumoniae]|nr:integral membrane protein [Streptococcus pneumoniae]VIS44627.1 integral membrane protein [Streptococcus pneumoniae]VJC33885.1 integral membrane protein [Streptococcus pneumoniae]VJF13342.1 integral membrane protein [Streptococcus pneumoniae]VJF48708.1 integral membrane protein [Streptococcus pneumoniae]